MLGGLDFFRTRDSSRKRSSPHSYSSLAVSDKGITLVRSVRPATPAAMASRQAQLDQYGDRQFGLFAGGLEFQFGRFAHGAVRVRVAADAAIHSLAPVVCVDRNSLGEQWRQSCLNLFRGARPDRLDPPKAEPIGQLASEMDQGEKVYRGVVLGIVMAGGDNLKILRQVPLRRQQAAGFAVIHTQRFPLAVQQFEDVAAGVA